MKITRRQLRKIIKEQIELIQERSNQAIYEIESELRHTLAEYIDIYMMSMSMNPGNAADRQRVYRKINDIVGTLIG
tara:strand:+ start:268 stop:495 length:228 start_codon:yes stop_codon:yes gene_type:complete